METIQNTLTELWDIMPYAISLVIVFLQLAGLTPYNELTKYFSDLTVNQELQARTHTVGLFIPSTCNKKDLVDNTSHLNEAKVMFGTLFGGYTCLIGLGGWVFQETKELFEEPVILIFSMVTQEELEAHQEVIKQFANHLRIELHQEAISVVIDGDLNFC